MEDSAENEISVLVTPELFGAYIGKTPSAIRKMAQSRKLPVVYMKDPESKSNTDGEIYINRKEWDDYAIHLAKVADPEWHSWKDRLSVANKNKVVEWGKRFLTTTKKRVKAK
ncbi:TPA: Cox family DNA-binding protein [Salmonella enterica]|nr:hypothetical protein [Salmonella enterica]EHQ4706874.1 hypothetical protein [Salmonella enterica]EHS4915948.1 hypothetical protein [Salmonella enterica]